MSINDKYGNFPLLGPLVAILSLPHLYTLHNVWDKYRLFIPCIRARLLRIRWSDWSV